MNYEFRDPVSSLLIETGFIPLLNMNKFIGFSQNLSRKAMVNLKNNCSYSLFLFLQYEHPLILIWAVNHNV